MRLYAAYGSNLNILQMKKRCPKSFPICTIYLQDWSLVFKGVADLERKKGSICLLGIYEISKQCERFLDIYEEFPTVYEKRKIKKRVEGRIREIMFYTMNKKYKYAIPTEKYFKVIEEGFRNWNGYSPLLYNACFESINKNTDYGYKSENWKDKKYVNKKFLKKRFL